MNNQALRKLATVSCFIMLAALLSLPASGQEGQEALSQADRQINPRSSRGPNQEITIRPVMAMSDGSVVPRAGTMLVRTRDNVFATIHTSGLPPGAAVTAWFGIFNNPRNCATRPCTAADFSNPAVQGSRVNFGGQIIGADGTATFGAFRTVGDTTGAFDGPGLLDPLRAEIHLVTRTHGPAILDDPETLRQQLSIFNGGCPPNTCANLQASIHQP